MQNKANFRKAGMKLNFYSTKDYEKEHDLALPKNKPNLCHRYQTQLVVSLPAVPVLSLPKGARSNRRTYFKGKKEDGCEGV